MEVLGRENVYENYFLCILTPQAASGVELFGSCVQLYLWPISDSFYRPRER